MAGSLQTAQRAVKGIYLSAIFLSFETISNGSPFQFISSPQQVTLIPLSSKVLMHAMMSPPKKGSVKNWISSNRMISALEVISSFKISETLLKLKASAEIPS